MIEVEIIKGEHENEWSKYGAIGKVGSTFNHLYCSVIFFFTVLLKTICICPAVIEHTGCLRRSILLD